MSYAITEQYLGPLASNIRSTNVGADVIVEFIADFVSYNKHAETLTKLNTMLEGGTWDSHISDVCYRGGLNDVEEQNLYDLLELARGEIRRRMSVFEQDQLTILKQK